MNPDRVPKTRAVWPTLRVKIIRRKTWIGIFIFQASWALQPIWCLSSIYMYIVSANCDEAQTLCCKWCFTYLFNLSFSYSYHVVCCTAYKHDSSKVTVCYSFFFISHYSTFTTKFSLVSSLCKQAQSIVCKDSSPKWSAVCRVGR